LIRKGGWYAVPAAFFLLLNFSASGVKGLFFVRLIYFLFLLAVFFLCRSLSLGRLLAPISGGIALILFTYGIVQKFIIFPKLLGQVAAGPSWHAQALQARLASGRIFAIFPLPTLYAMVCGLLLIFIVHYLLGSRGLLRLGWLFLFLLGGINLVLTQSFGGILFFTAGILFYLFTSRTFNARFLAPLLMVLALIFFAVTALRFSEAKELSPARLRFANWAQAGRLILSAPLLGAGLGNYETAIQPFVQPDEPASIYAHNFFLQAAAETGIPLFLLLFLLGIPWLRANLSRFLDPGSALFASASILILFFNLFDVGNYFFASGISFVVVLSQVGQPATPTRVRHFVFAVLLALPLLVQAMAENCQQAGDLWLSYGDTARAGALYRSALKLQPFSYRPWLGLAHIAWEEGRLPDAERHLTEVLRLFPGQPFANFRLSQAMLRRGMLLTSLFHAGRAAAGGKKNSGYRRWHESIQGILSQQSALPGN
jgi:tetratricopeptide (TPR) repeat protein